ncbi:MAG: hypothetical protein V3U98_12330 [Acidobacteriota bacterium]
MTIVHGEMTISAVLETLLHRLDMEAAVAVVGPDGVVIEQRSAGEPANLEMLSAGNTSLLKQARIFLRDTSKGEPSELILTSDRQLCIARVVAREYFLLVALGSEASLGRLRYETRRASLLLEDELH